MAWISNISLDDFKAMDIIHARLGILLQIHNGEGPAVVLRCADPQLGVVSLEGNNAGILFYDSDLLSHIVIDISELASIALTRPAPRSSRQQPCQPGEICHLDNAGEPLIALAITRSTDPQLVVGYVPLRGAFCGQMQTATGTVVCLGNAVIVPKDQKGGAR